VPVISPMGSPPIMKLGVGYCQGSVNGRPSACSSAMAACRSSIVTCHSVGGLALAESRSCPVGAEPRVCRPAPHRGRGVADGPALSFDATRPNSITPPSVVWPMIAPPASQADMRRPGIVAPTIPGRLAELLRLPISAAQISRQLISAGRVEGGQVLAFAPGAPRLTLADSMLDDPDLPAWEMLLQLFDEPVGNVIQRMILSCSAVRWVTSAGPPGGDSPGGPPDRYRRLRRRSGR